MSCKYCIWCGVEMEHKDDICPNCEKEQKSSNSHTKDFLIKYSKKKALDSIKDKSKDKLSALLLAFIKSHLWGTILVISALIAIIAAAIPEPQAPALVATSYNQPPTTKPRPTASATTAPIGTSTPAPTEALAEEPSPTATIDPPRPTVKVMTYSPEADKYGATGGGVIVLQRNGKYGAIDYEGNVITDFQYSDYMYGPTVDGYYIFGDLENADDDSSYKFDVFDNNGKLVFSKNHASDSYGNRPYVVISEGYLQYLYSYDELEDGYGCYCVYNLETKELNEVKIEAYHDTMLGISGFDHKNGNSYISENYNLYKVTKTGEVTRFLENDKYGVEEIVLADGKTYPAFSRIFAGVAENDGYIGAEAMYGWYTKAELQPALIGVYDSANDCYMFADLSVFCNSENIDGTDLALIISSGDISYANRGTEIVVRAYDNSTNAQKFYVFDLSKGNYKSITDGMKIAANVDDMLKCYDVEGTKTYCFDSIWPSDTDIYLFQQAGKYGYIKEDGTAKLYDDAQVSGFIGGYALILENNTVYLIDTEFEKVNTIAEVSDGSAVWKYDNGLYYVDGPNGRRTYVVTP